MVVKKKTTAKKVAAKKSSARAGAPGGNGSASAMPGRKGDRILIDSPHVGSPPREGEVLSVIQGEVSVSYKVKWDDGHESLITPVAGTARIVRR